jgi:hypothetical protein
MKVKSGERGQDSWGQECWDRTARTGEPFRSPCTGPTAGTASFFSTPDMQTKDVLGGICKKNISFKIYITM